MLDVDPLPADFSLPFPCLALDQRKGEAEGGINHLSHHCFPRRHHCHELPSPAALSFTNTTGALNVWALLCSLKHLPCPDFTIHLLPFADKDFKLIGQHGVLVIFLLPLPKCTSALPLFSYHFVFPYRWEDFPIQSHSLPAISLFSNKLQDLSSITAALLSTRKRTLNMRGNITETDGTISSLSPCTSLDNRGKCRELLMIPVHFPSGLLTSILLSFWPTAPFFTSLEIIYFSSTFAFFPLLADMSTFCFVRK